MLSVLELIAVTLTILTALVALIRTMILSPLDKKLDSHADRLLVTIEHRFLDAITKRLDYLETMSHARSRQGILWSRALHQALAEQNVRSPDPDMYVWEPASGPDSGSDR